MTDGPPPAGWNDLVTNQVLEARLATLEHTVLSEMARGFQRQTWRVIGATVVAFGVFATLVQVT